VPDSVLSQLGHRVQHALRAFTPRDVKTVKACAQTMRPKAGLDIEAAITELAVGEALVSFLNHTGRPTEIERVFVLPPAGQLGPITPEQRQTILRHSLVAGVYEAQLDRASAFETLRAQAPDMNESAVNTAKQSIANATQPKDDEAPSSMWTSLLFGSSGPRGGQRDGLAQMVMKSAVRTVGSNIGRQVVRGLLGGLLGSRKH
jgi:hypothetical protein